MREGRQKGAEVMVNLTSDVWYPNSKLPRQHLDHARVRTVENGIPLIRACNTGVTAAIDSLGKNVSVLGGDQPEKVEWVADGLVVHVPLYSYHTLYSKLGDSLIIGISMIFVLAGFLSSRKRP
jgi:apolipoprotein N-acyltransferase